MIKSPQKRIKDLTFTEDFKIIVVDYGFLEIASWGYDDIVTETFETDKIVYRYNLKEVNQNEQTKKEFAAFKAQKTDPIVDIKTLNGMDCYGPLPTNDEYEERVRARYENENDCPIYNIAETSFDGKRLWYPYEVDTDGEPYDGTPYDVFRFKKKAIECVKRIGGIIAEDYSRMRYD